MLRSGIHSCKWHGRLPLAVGYRWQSTDQKVQEEVKPFSAIPSPSGALPIIGHQRLLKDVTSISKFVTEKFRELGPIFRLHFIGKIMHVCVCVYYDCVGQFSVIDYRFIFSVISIFTCH